MQLLLIAVFLFLVVVVLPVSSWLLTSNRKSITHQRHPYYYSTQSFTRSSATDITSRWFALLQQQQVEEEGPIPVNNMSSASQPEYDNSHIATFGLADEEFETWFLAELQEHPLSERYPELFIKAATAVTNWRRRFRGDPALWKRLFKKDRVVKEFVEAVPILDALLTWMESSNATNITILDLACGKGYLSMMMSEVLPPDRVLKCIMIDKQWPMATNTSTPQSHHINWDHIYGHNPALLDPNSSTPPPPPSPSSSIGMESCYFGTWPIPLHTSKQNLKSGGDKRSIAKRFIDAAPGPVVILAVHLCGTLSFSAVELMNLHDKVQFLALKPCCLPDYRLRKDNLFIPPDYTFAGADVCAQGQWKNKNWKGPPRWHLEDRFHAWCHHLYQGIAVQPKESVQAQVQLQGGYQNTFLFARREEVSKLPTMVE